MEKVGVWTPKDGLKITDSYAFLQGKSKVENYTFQHSIRNQNLSSIFPRTTSKHNFARYVKNRTAVRHAKQAKRWKSPRGQQQI